MLVNQQHPLCPCHNLYILHVCTSPTYTVYNNPKMKYHCTVAVACAILSSNKFHNDIKIRSILCIFQTHNFWHTRESWIEIINVCALDFALYNMTICGYNICTNICSHYKAKNVTRCTDSRSEKSIKNITRCRDSRSAKSREQGLGCILNCFMLSSLPCFPAYFADLLSLHLVTFLMIFNLAYVTFFRSRCMLELMFAIYHKAASLPS